MKTCGRCGSRLERGSVQIAISSVDDSGSAETTPPLDACRTCAKSFSRWVGRGQNHSQAPRKPKAPPPKKKSSRHGKYRPTRQQIALGVVVLLALMFAYYLSKSFTE